MLAAAGVKYFAAGANDDRGPAAALRPVADPFALLVAGSGWRQSADGLHAPVFAALVRLRPAAARGRLPRRPAGISSDLRIAGLPARRRSDVRKPTGKHRSDPRRGRVRSRLECQVRLAAPATGHLPRLFRDRSRRSSETGSKPSAATLDPIGKTASAPMRNTRRSTGRPKAARCRWRHSPRSPRFRSPNGRRRSTDSAVCGAICSSMPNTPTHPRAATRGPRANRAFVRLRPNTSTCPTPARRRIGSRRNP